MAITPLYVAALLVSSVVAFPGMGANMRREAAPIARQASTTTSTAASSSSFPAWHPPGDGDGTYYFGKPPAAIANLHQCDLLALALTLWQITASALETAKATPSRF